MAVTMVIRVCMQRTEVLDGLQQGVSSGQVAWVPGSFEMPIVAKAMAKSGRFDAVITVGAVVGSRPAPALWPSPFIRSGS